MQVTPPGKQPLKMTSLSLPPGQGTAEDRALLQLLTKRRPLLARAAAALRRSGQRVALLLREPEQDLFCELIPTAKKVTAPPQDTSDYDVILADFTHAVSPAWAQFVSRAALSGIEVWHPADFAEARLGKVSVEHFSPAHIRRGRRRGYAAAKRLLDIVTVIAAAPAATLLTTIAAAAIYFRMGAPVFFAQDRVGENGKVFRMYKLRTMRPPRQGDRVKATCVNDDRITPLGAILRRFRIDELPQFVNILKGDMSLVGPRPEQPKLAGDYAMAIPSFEHRHMVKPGITGWAQVMYGYASTLSETRRKLSYDLFYVKHASLALDCEILVRTVVTLLRGNAVR